MPKVTATGSPAGADRLLTPRFVLVVTAGLAYFMSLGVMLPVVPQYVEQEMRGGDLAVGIAVGAFSVGAVLLRPIAGRIGDRAGRRVLIVGGAALVAVSAALHGVAPEVVSLVVVRVVGGIGEAAFFVGAGTMVTDLAPEHRRGEAISYWSVSVYGGLAFGPLIGEIVLGGTDRGGRTTGAHFGSVWVLATALAALAAILGLATRESLSREDRARRGDPPAPLLHRRALTPGLVLFLGMVPFAGFAAFVPLYVDDIGVADSAGAFLLYGVVVLVVRLAGARIPDRIGPLASGTIATSMIAVGMVVVAALGSAAGLYLGTVAFALGMAFLYPAMLMLGLTGVPERERGSAVGTVSTFFDLSQGVGAALLGAVASLSSYRGAFVAGAILSVGALVLLRSGADPRAKGPVDHAAFEEARAHVEPEPP